MPRFTDRSPASPGKAPIKLAAISARYVVMGATT
jgi:hypothetical protein